MSDIAKHENCAGCGACAEVCPVEAINLFEDENGFIQARIDDDVCIGCGRCRKACPALTPADLRSQTAVYAVQSRSQEVLLTSASGGAFFELARTFLQQGGTVYGAAMDIEDSQARIVHKPARNEAELAPLQGSKYAQGASWPVFHAVKQALASGERVLFSGLPCQVAGLYGYLGRDYDNLITVDIFCHGNTSENHLNIYLRYLRDKYHHAVEGYVFRDKERGVGYKSRLVLSNGREVRMTAMQEAYWYLYQSSKIYRESCHSCPYACDRRVGDISLGDFWGIEQQRPETLRANGGTLDSDYGISVVLANTSKGDELVRGCDFICEECSISDVIPGGAAVRAPQPMPTDRETVLAMFRANDYKAIKRYSIRQMGVVNYLYDLFADTAPVKLLRSLLGRA